MTLYHDLSCMILHSPNITSIILITILDNREIYNADENVNPILSESLFREYVSPILLKVFQVRDVQIRSVLLR